MSIKYLDISKEKLEVLYKTFGTQQKIADYLKVPVYKIKQLVGKYQLYLNKSSLTKNKGIKLLEIKYNEEIENKLENFFDF